MTPAAFTLELLRDAGWCADVVERYVEAAKIRRDFIGCVDVIAFRPGFPVLGVQATTADHARSMS